ncbi:hypothetical protein SprV_0702418300 [Sparganum proliferum]
MFNDGITWEPSLEVQVKTIEQFDVADHDSTWTSKSYSARHCRNLTYVGEIRCPHSGHPWILDHLVPSIRQDDVILSPMHPSFSRKISSTAIFSDVPRELERYAVHTLDTRGYWTTSFHQYVKMT